MHLTRLLACIHAGTVPLVRKTAPRLRKGARAANTLRTTMEWPENPAFPPCFSTRVADAMFLYGAYRSLHMLIYGETRAEDQPRFAAARAHLPRDVAEVAMHPAFHEFKQRFINFCAHFGYTHPHPFPTDRDAMGDPAPPDAVAGGVVPVPPPPLRYPNLLLQQMLHLCTPCAPILDGDAASSSDASSFDGSSFMSAFVDIDSSYGVLSVTVVG